ncbi:MAG: hypothetical protein ACUVXI_15595 [bacterium]
MGLAPGNFIQLNQWVVYLFCVDKRGPEMESSGSSEQSPLSGAKLQRWQSYDSYDVEPNLKSCESTIAVLAYHYGCRNNYTRDARAGLFVQLEATYSDGREEAFGTDSTGGCVRRGAGAAMLN